MYSEPVMANFPRDKQNMKGILEVLLPEAIIVGIYNGMCAFREEKIAEGMYKTSEGEAIRKFKAPLLWEFYIFLAMLLYSGGCINL